MDILTATQIAASPEFQARVRFSMIARAVINLGGTPTQPTILLAQRILDDRESLSTWVAAVLSDSSIMAGAHTVPGNTIDDAAVNALVSGVWAAFEV